MAKKRDAREPGGPSPDGPATSRRRFLRRLAYVPPAILTFVANRANAQAGSCRPAQCRPATCTPGDCTPGPCAPASCRPNN